MRSVYLPIVVSPDDIATVEIEFIPPREQSWQEVNSTLRKYGFDVVKMSLNSLGVYTALITLESYERSDYYRRIAAEHSGKGERRTRVSEHHQERLFIPLEKGATITNPHYHNTRLVELLKYPK